jgi:hypothetical protein
MKELFMSTTEKYIENFEIIFDRAKNEKTAMSNAVDYYLTVTEDDEVDLDVDEIIEIAESYGFDFSDFGEQLEKNK